MEEKDTNEIAKPQPPEEAEVLQWTATADALKERVAKLRTVCINAKKQIDIYRTQKSNLRFEYERFAARRLGFTWHVMVLILAAGIFASFQAQMYGVTVVMVFCFLANWRALYVYKTHNSFLFSMAAVVASLFFIMRN